MSRKAELRGTNDGTNNGAWNFQPAHLRKLAHIAFQSSRSSRAQEHELCMYMQRARTIYALASRSAGWACYVRATSIDTRSAYIRAACRQVRISTRYAAAFASCVSIAQFILSLAVSSNANVAATSHKPCGVDCSLVRFRECRLSFVVDVVYRS